MKNLEDALFKIIASYVHWGEEKEFMLAWFFFCSPENIFNQFSTSSTLLDPFLLKCEGFCQPRPTEAPASWLLSCNAEDGALFLYCA